MKPSKTYCRPRRAGGVAPTNLLDAIRVPRMGPGRPPTRPDAVLADKAYCSRGNRGLFCSRGITAVIAEPWDQAGNRKRKGSKGGRQPTFDAEPYKGRNVIERSFNVLKQWRGLATRYDKLALTNRDGVVRNHVTRWRSIALCCHRRCPSAQDCCMIRMSKH
jgi:transposase